MSTVPERLTAALASHYRIERCIGAGGMATVYLAHDLKHDRRVAIKVLREELATTDGSARFLREIRLAARLSHQNILALFDSGSAHGLMYYVMPFVEEPTLRDRIRQEGTLTVDEALRLAREIADGLQYAHEQGVVHRDIKPENILQWRGHAVIADFGIGKAFADVTEQTLTMTGMSLGTPAYMSPEQATADSIVDQRADIYSLACVLFEMLTGRPPFTGPNAHVVIARHCGDPRPSPSALRKDTPSYVDHAVRKAMAVEVTERFTSCNEFSKALGSEAGGAKRAYPTRSPWHAWTLAVTLLTLVTAAVYFNARIGDGRRSRSMQVYADNPTPSAWVDKTGEAYSIIATLDSLLVVYRFRSPAVLTYNGTQWTGWALPDSFELRPFQGALHGGRLLATRRGTDAKGSAQVQLWWLELTATGIRPLEPITDPEPDVPQPYWWFDGRTVITWLETIRKKTPQGWALEPTAAQASVITMWGRDEAHRYAIADMPRDSLLVNDGIGWQKQDILPDQSAGRPEFAGGVLLGDGASVVFGQRCVTDAQCTPLIAQQLRAGGAWLPLAIAAGVGIPRLQPRKTDAGCVNRFDILGAAGRSVEDYYVWGEWTFCRGDGLRRVDTGCPREHPCVWHVVAGELTPSSDLTGKVMLGVAIVRGSYYSVFDDGAIWHDTTGRWRPLAQLPNLPSRLVGASAHVVVLSTGTRITYQPSGSTRTRLVVSPMRGVPPSVNDSAPPRRIVVRDTTVALVTAVGTVFVATCRGTTGMQSASEDRQCGRWVPLGASREPVNDVDILPDGAIIAVGQRGFAAVWRGGAWRSEPLPAAARDDSLWGVRVSTNGIVMAAGMGVVLARTTQGRWSVTRRHELGLERLKQFVVLPDGGVAVADGRIRMWDGQATTSEGIVLHRRIQGEGRVSALHVIADGRLVAGFANTNEPGVGGWLQVWTPPLRENRWQRVELPMNVDVADLADDGTLLYVVGRGGSMAIRLDSLPFATGGAANTTPLPPLRPR